MIEVLGAIDESGDLGFEKDSSSHFVVAAILIAKKTESQKILDEVNTYCKEIGWRGKHETLLHKYPHKKWRV